MIAIRILSIIAMPIVQSICIVLAYAFERSFGLFGIAAFLATDFFLIPFFSANTSKMKTFAYSFPPLMLIAAVFGLLFLVESEAVKAAVIWTNALAQFLYGLNMYYALFRTEQYQMRSLYHSDTIIRILLFFCLSSVAYGLSYYADVPYWITFPILCGISIFSICGALALRGIAIRPSLPFIAAIGLCISEAFLAIALLPSIYYVSATLWTVTACAAVQLSLSSLQKENSRFEIVTTVGLTTIVVLLVLATAQWR